MNLPPEYWSLLQLSAELRRGTITSTAVTTQMLDRIDAVEPITQSYATVTADSALAQAKKADDEIARGFWRGPLHGVPIALKDLCFTKTAPTSAGMAIYKNWLPDYDATVVKRLYEAGAISLGKLKMTEGAGATHHPSVDSPRNPWNGDYWPGISSSGSGVATAAGLCFGSLGSDTGGSIRYPSSCNNITGVKPTYGRVSRHGIFTLSDSLDHIGPMARNASDCAAILNVIAGSDLNDPTTLDEPVLNYLENIEGGIRGVRLGVDFSYAGEDSDNEVVSALSEAQRVLVSLGAEIKEIRFPSIDRAVTTWMQIFGAEALDAHRDTYPSRAEEYGPLAPMLEMGLAAPALAFAEAARERRKFCGLVQRLWRDIDLLLVPTIPMTVPTAKEAESFTQAKNMMRVMRFTFPFNLTGSPCISLPSGFSKNGLPIGMQLVGPHLSELLLCRAGHAFQQISDWHTHHPKL